MSRKQATQWIVGIIFFIVGNLAIGKVEGAPILKQVHVVTRHGSRLELYKNAETLAEAGSAALTPLGEKECYDTGVWLRDFFRNETNFFDVFNVSKVSLLSSWYDRTVVSANSLLLGLFPDSARDPLNLSFIPGTPANVPVYTLSLEDDVMIHGYDKCAAGMNLEGIYLSSPWLNLQSENSALLDTLANFSYFQQYLVNGTLPLYNLWNVFDAISVAKTECGADPTSPYCTPYLADLLTTSEWTHLQSLTRASEEMKYGGTTTGPLVGGNLLFQILATMSNTNLSSSNEMEHFYLYSAHYPTLLGLFATLKDPRVDYSALPPYASALIFQLFQDSVTLDQTVEVIFKPGENGTHQVLSLGQLCSFQTCTLDQLTALLPNLSMVQWCTTCQNHEAKPCMVIDGSAVSSPPLCSGFSSGVVAGTAVGTFFAGMLGALLLFYLLKGAKSTINVTHGDAAREGGPAASENQPALVA